MLAGQEGRQEVAAGPPPPAEGRIAMTGDAPDLREHGSTEGASIQSSADATTTPAAEDPFWEFISKDIPQVRTAAGTSVDSIAGTSTDLSRPEMLPLPLDSGDIGLAPSGEPVCDSAQTKPSYAALPDAAAPEAPSHLQQPVSLPPPQMTGLCRYRCTQLFCEQVGEERPCLAIPC